MQSAQSPIGSGFGPASTAADVIAGIDLTGKNTVVTGGASGIGIPTVQALRSAGARSSCLPATSSADAEVLAGLDVEIQPMDLHGAEDDRRVRGAVPRLRAGRSICS